MSKIQIENELLEELMSKISSIVSNNSSIYQLINEDNFDNNVLSKNIEELNRDVREMQNIVMDMKMISTKSLFEDITNDLKKEYQNIDISSIDNEILIDTNQTKEIKKFIIKTIEKSINITENEKYTITLESIKESSNIVINIKTDFILENLSDTIDNININCEYFDNQLNIYSQVSLSIIDVLEIEIDKIIFLLPLGNMVETIQPTEDMIKMVGDGTSELLMLREDFIPIVRLNKIFNFGIQDKDLTKGVLIIVKHNHEKIAIYSDKFLEQVQTAVKSIEKNFVEVDGINSATIRAKGEVGLILDIKAIMAKKES